MRKTIQVILAMMMCVSLTACGKKQESIQENPETQQKFDEYLDELFDESVASDFLTYHFMLVNPQERGIEKPEVSLGTLSTEENKAEIEEARKELEELHTFDKNELNQEQRNLYRAIETNLNLSLEEEKYGHFDFPFGGNKVNENLITNFTEYRIGNLEDVKDFIMLLEDTERYLNEGIESTRRQAENGNIQNEAIKEYVVEQCTKFLDSQEIQKYFASQIAEIKDISENEKAEYQKQVNHAVENVMKPAYEDIISLYEQLPESQYQGSLSEMKNGKEYFEWLLKCNTGSHRSAKEWGEIAKEEVISTVSEIILIMYQGDPEEEVRNTVKAPTEDIQEMVEYLETSLIEEFPEIDKVHYTVSLLDESVANDLTVAYYVKPPVDATDLNTIKVNPKYKNDMVGLMATLSHEGFPGHLYQNNYLVQNSTYEIYHLISNIGYSEGWANYVGNDIYRLCGLGSETAQKYLRLNEYFGYMLYGYYDIMINYDGWDVEQVAEDLSQLGLVPELAEDLYNTMITYPSMYAPYSFGMYEMVRLKEKAQEELGPQFDVKSFNQALLDVGPLTFDVVSDAIDQYIEENK